MESLPRLELDKKQFNINILMINFYTLTKMSRYIVDMSTIYRVSEGIYMIMGIDYRLYKKYLKYH